MYPLRDIGMVIGMEVKGEDKATGIMAMAMVMAMGGETKMKVKIEGNHTDCGRATGPQVGAGDAGGDTEEGTMDTTTTEAQARLQLKKETVLTLKGGK